MDQAFWIDFFERFQGIFFYPFPSAMPFNASLNSIVVSREYFMDFSCTYDLVYYPFDTQVQFTDLRV